MSDAQAEELVPPGVQEALFKAGALPEGPTREDLSQFLLRANADSGKGPVAAAEATTSSWMGLGRGLVDPDR